MHRGCRTSGDFQVRVEGPIVVIRGSNAALARVASAKSEGGPHEVPSIGPNWLPTKNPNLA